MSGSKNDDFRNIISNDEDEYRFVNSRLDDGALNDFEFGTNVGVQIENEQPRYEECFDTGYKTNPPDSASIIFRLENSVDPKVIKPVLATKDAEIYSFSQIQQPRRRGERQVSHEDVPPLGILSCSSSQERLANGLPPVPKAAPLDINILTDDEDDNMDDLSRTLKLDYSEQPFVDPKQWREAYFPGDNTVFQWYVPPSSLYTDQMGMPLLKFASLSLEDNRARVLYESQREAFLLHEMAVSTSKTNSSHSEPHIHPKNFIVENKRALEEGQVTPRPRVSYGQLYYDRAQRYRQAAKLAHKEKNVEKVDVKSLTKKFPQADLENVYTTPSSTLELKQTNIPSSTEKSEANEMEKWEKIDEEFHRQLMQRRAARYSADHLDALAPLRDVKIASSHYDLPRLSNQHIWTNMALLQQQITSNLSNGYGQLPPIHSTRSTRTDANDGYLSRFAVDQQVKQGAKKPAYKPYTLSDFQNLKTMEELGGLGPDTQMRQYKIKKEMSERRRIYADQILHKPHESYTSRLQRQTLHSDAEKNSTAFSHSNIPIHASFNSSLVSQLPPVSQQNNASPSNNKRTIAMKISASDPGLSRASLSKRELMIKYSNSLRMRQLDPLHLPQLQGPNSDKHSNHSSKQTKDFIVMKDLDNVVLLHQKERKQLHQFTQQKESS